jgi:hypothetical protein
VRGSASQGWRRPAKAFFIEILVAETKESYKLFKKN